MAQPVRRGLRTVEIGQDLSTKGQPYSLQKRGEAPWSAQQRSMHTKRGILSDLSDLVSSILPGFQRNTVSNVSQQSNTPNTVKGNTAVSNDRGATSLATSTGNVVSRPMNSVVTVPLLSYYGPVIGTGMTGILPVTQSTPSTISSGISVSSVAANASPDLMPIVAYSPASSNVPLGGAAIATPQTESTSKSDQSANQVVTPNSSSQSPTDQQTTSGSGQALSSGTTSGSGEVMSSEQSSTAQNVLNDSSDDTDPSATVEQTASTLPTSQPSSGVAIVPVKSGDVTGVAIIPLGSSAQSKSVSTGAVSEGSSTGNTNTNVGVPATTPIVSDDATAANTTASTVQGAPLPVSGDPNRWTNGQQVTNNKTPMGSGHLAPGQASLLNATATNPVVSSSSTTPMDISAAIDSLKSASSSVSAGVKASTSGGSGNESTTGTTLLSSLLNPAIKLLEAGATAGQT